MNSQSLLSDELKTCPKYFNKVIEFLNHELSNAVNTLVYTAELYKNQSESQDYLIDLIKKQSESVLSFRHIRDTNYDFDSKTRFFSKAKENYLLNLENIMEEYPKTKGLWGDEFESLLVSTASYMKKAFSFTGTHNPHYCSLYRLMDEYEANMFIKDDLTITLDLDSSSSQFIDFNNIIYALLNLGMNSYQSIIKKFDDPKKDGRINIVFDENEEYFLILHGDNGTGMPYTEAKNLFRQKMTTKADKKNHGIGSGIIRDIVNQHEGFIQVESFERLGSIICLGLKKL